MLKRVCREIRMKAWKGARMKPDKNLLQEHKQTVVAWTKILIVVEVREVIKFWVYFEGLASKILWQIEGVLWDNRWILAISFSTSLLQKASMYKLQVSKYELRLPQGFWPESWQDISVFKVGEQHRGIDFGEYKNSIFEHVWESIRHLVIDIK